MHENADLHLWLNRALFLSLCLFAVLASMLPLGLSADAPVMPDLLICIAFAWVLRRPATAPYGLIVGAAFFADLMLMRVPGIWTMRTLLATEFARLQQRPIQERPFVVEWLIFALVFAAALVLERVLMTISFSPRAGFDLTINYYLTTTAVYPAVVAVLHWIFRIRGPRSAGGPDRLGRVA